MNRRTFAGLGLAALGGIFVPQYGRWHRQGSGLLVAEDSANAASLGFQPDRAILWDGGNVEVVGTVDIVGFTNDGFLLSFHGETCFVRYDQALPPGTFATYRGIAYSWNVMATAAGS